MSELAFDAFEREMWTDRAAAFGASFALLCAGAAPALLDAAEVTVGTKILDVGTATGTVARLAQQRGAVVSAIDAERSMVEATRAFIPDVRHGRLPDLPFIDGTFDVAVANFVVNHVGDPLAAIRGMRRVVRPGGTIAVTIWPTPSPTSSLAGAAIAAAGVVPPPAPRLEPEHDFARTTDGLGDLLTRAGLTDVTTRLFRWEHRTDPEVWWSGSAGGVGAIGHAVTSQTPEVIAKIKQEYDRLAADYLDSDGLLRLPTSAVLATGRV
jgi:SAM-dependent methyltransferase